MCFLRMGALIKMNLMLDEACLHHLEIHVVPLFLLQLGLSLMGSAQWHFLLHGLPPKLNFVKENLIIGTLFHLLFTEYIQLSFHSNSGLELASCAGLNRTTEPGLLYYSPSSARTGLVREPHSS